MRDSPPDKLAIRSLPSWCIAIDGLISRVWSVILRAKWVNAQWHTAVGLCRWKKCCLVLGLLAKFAKGSFSSTRLFVLTFSSPQISCWWSMLMAIQIFNCRPQPKLSYSHSNTLSALFGNGERYKDCPIQNLRGVSHSFCKFKFPALHRTGVTVSYIYLLQSPLSRSPLQPGHFAHRIPGTSTSSQALRRPFSQCPLH